MLIICTVCPEGSPEIEEEKYIEHMEKLHPKGQLAAISAKKNVPKKKDLPPGIKEGDLPTPEFMETMAEIAKEQEKPPVEAPVPPQTPPSTEIKPPPLELIYLYKGLDKNNHEVSTLEMDIDNVHFVVAYCLQEKQQIEVRRVPKLESKNELSNLPKRNNNNSISNQKEQGEILLPKMQLPRKTGKTNLE